MSYGLYATAMLRVARGGRRGAAERIGSHDELFRWHCILLYGRQWHAGAIVPVRPMLLPEAAGIRKSLGRRCFENIFPFGVIHTVSEIIIPKGKMLQFACFLAKRSWLPYGASNPFRLKTFLFTLACRLSARCAPVCSKHPSTCPIPANRKHPLTRLLPFGALTVPLARVWCAR